MISSSFDYVAASSLDDANAVGGVDEDALTGVAKESTA